MNDRKSSEYAKLLGANLRKARRERGWSLADMEYGSAGRWTAVAIGSYERGDRQLSVSKLAELAEFYGVPVAELLPDPASVDLTPDGLRVEALRLSRRVAALLYAAGDGEES